MTRDEAIGSDATPVEVSIVMPCLNESDTLAICLEKASRSLRESGIEGEIIVADNGSTDGSQAIALEADARLVSIEQPGYGSALMGGIAAARGEFIVMGDSDNSYDFLEIPRFVEKLREGFELVQGCRLPRGGGVIAPGAMPFLHRFVGNPLFTRLARWWFKSPVNDVYCGLRGFSRGLYVRLDQQCTGMEFATEMIIKASLSRASVTEVPITLHPDGRVSSAPHLRTFADGWRTLRLYLLYCPRWLFLAPGLALVLLGLLGYSIALPGLTFGRVTFDVHTLLFASLSILCGVQALAFALFTKTFAVSERLMPEDRRLTRFFELFNLELGVLISMACVVIGLVLLALAVNSWRMVDFGRLDYAETLRLVIPGATLTALGVQVMLASFFVSVLGIKRK